MSEEIKVPIKDMILKAMAYNGCDYEEEAISLLRMYFIAALNLRYIYHFDLERFVNKFTSKVKKIVQINNDSTLSYNEITKNKTLVISSGDDDKDIEFYKAVTEVLCCNEEKKDGSMLRTALTEIAAERIKQMSDEGSLIILPEKKTETICGKELVTRSGYKRFNLLITLVNQLLLLIDLPIIYVEQKTFYVGIEMICSILEKNKIIKLLLSTLDAIYSLYISRLTTGKSSDKELKLIETYQLYLNSIFKNNKSYIFFTATLTSDDLRNKCIKYKK